MRAAAASVCALLASTVSAFAPNSFVGRRIAVQQASSSSSALQMADASKLIGGKPFGDDTIFDPLGLAAKTTDIDLKRWQECEVKHGRVAMLASVGYITQEFFHPLFPVDYKIGPALRHFQIIEQEVPWFWVAAVFFVGIFEADNIYRGWKQQDPYTKGISELKDDYIPGDLGFDPLNFAPTSDMDKFATMRTKELNNGRLAMIAIFGFWGQELANYGSTVFGNVVP